MITIHHLHHLNLLTIYQAKQAYDFLFFSRFFIEERADLSRPWPFIGLPWLFTLSFFLCESALNLFTSFLESEGIILYEWRTTIV